MSLRWKEWERQGIWENGLERIIYLVLDTVNLGASSTFRKGCYTLGSGAQGTVQAKDRNLEMIS